MKRIAIFDSDGVLLDTHELVEKILPKSWRRFERKIPWLWNIIRKMTILFGGDKICDKRLRGIDEEVIFEIARDYEIFVLTKRPFWFGGRERLINQLNAVYGQDFFKESNIYSSCFSKHKGAVIQKKILTKRKNAVGFMVDDNEKNLWHIPAPIHAIWLNQNGKMQIFSNGQSEIYELKQLKKVLTVLENV